MILLKTIDEFSEWRSGISGSIGFVPTMGALHDGHLSLVASANAECDHTVVSIYVNPTQFSANEDFGAYPKTLEHDLSSLEPYRVDAIFIPTDNEMYPEGFSTYVLEQSVSERLEGASRPSHFRGVTTIVAKLFNIIRADRAFFGEKDAQQLRVLQKMVQDLNISTQIIPCTTIREPHGLAMSSRNEYLSAEDRLQAGIIHRSLMAAHALLSAGERSADRVRNMIEKLIEGESSGRIDYISIADNLSLDEVEDSIQGDVLISLAVFFGKTRLIDNLTWHIPD